MGATALEPPARPGASSGPPPSIPNGPRTDSAVAGAVDRRKVRAPDTRPLVSPALQRKSRGPSAARLALRVVRPCERRSEQSDEALLLPVDARVWAADRRWRLFAAVDSPRLRLPVVVSLCGVSPPRGWVVSSVYLTRLSALPVELVNLMPLVSWVIRRSSTAQTSDRQLSSPGKRPITLVRRLTSPSDLSSRLVERHLRRCLGG